MNSPKPLDRILAAGGLPIAAALAFGGQFLVSLRGTSQVATVVPGVALYLLAAVTMLLALRARCTVARAAAGSGATEGGAAGESGAVADGCVTAAPGDVEESFLAGKAGWIVLAIIVAVGGYLRLDRIDTVPPGLNNDEAINAIETKEIVAGKPFRSVTER